MAKNIATKRSSRNDPLAARAARVGISRAELERERPEVRELRILMAEQIRDKARDPGTGHRRKAVPRESDRAADTGRQDAARGDDPVAVEGAPPGLTEDAMSRTARAPRPGEEPKGSVFLGEFLYASPPDALATRDLSKDESHQWASMSRTVVDALETHLEAGRAVAFDELEALHCALTWGPEMLLTFWGIAKNRAQSRARAARRIATSDDPADKVSVPGAPREANRMATLLVPHLLLGAGGPRGGFTPEKALDLVRIGLRDPRAFEKAIRLRQRRKDHRRQRGETR